MQMKIAYLLSRFPSQYQSYVAREILAMKMRGYETKIFSLKPPIDFGHKDSAPLLKDLYYKPFVASWCVWQSNLKLFFNRPAFYLSLVWYVLRNNFMALMILLKALSVFPKTVHYAYIMRQMGVTHLHAHWSTLPAFCAIVCSKILGIDYSMTCHAVDIFGPNNMLKEKLIKAKFVVTCAGHNKQHLIKCYPGMDADKIFINYHGFDLEKVKRSKNARTEPLEIISVGRIEASKGYLYLLKACAALKRDGNRAFHCTIIGDGPDRKYILRLMQRFDLSDVLTLAGALPYEEVIDYYENASISVLAAVSEFHRGIPNVVAESMAMEVPVITTPLPALAEIIEDGVNGILVPEKNHEALGDAIFTLIKSKNLRDSIAKKGRKTIENVFDMRKTYKELSDIFEKHLW